MHCRMISLLAKFFLFIYFLCSSFSLIQRNKILKSINKTKFSTQNKLFTISEKEVTNSILIGAIDNIRAIFLEIHLI